MIYSVLAMFAVVAIAAILIVLEVVYDMSKFKEGESDKPESTIARLGAVIIVSLTFFLTGIGSFIGTAMLLSALIYAFFDPTLNILRGKDWDYSWFEGDNIPIYGKIFFRLLAIAVGVWVFIEPTSTILQLIPWIK